MSSTPNFAATPRAAQGQVSASNTARDGTGTIVNILTAGASGSRIDMVMLRAVGTTTAGMIRLFLHDGTNMRLFHEAVVPAITPSATTPAFNSDITFDGGIILPAGWSLRASTHNAETFNVLAFGGDF